MIKFKFSSADLCIGRSGKVLLLDKFKVNSFGLVHGEWYLLVDPQIKELEKCRVVTGGTFIKVSDLPSNKTLSNFSVQGDKFENLSLHLTFNEERMYKEERVSSDTSYEDVPWEKAAFHSETICREFYEYVSEIQKNDYVIYDITNSFKNRFFYKKIGEYAQFNPGEVSAKNRVILIEKRCYLKFNRIGTGDTVEVWVRSEDVPLLGSGIEYTLKEVARNPKAVLMQISSPLMGNVVKEFFIEGDGTGSYMQYAYDLGYISSPIPEHLARPFGDDGKTVAKWASEGKLFTSYYSREWGTGGFDGTDNLFDVVPGLKEYVREQPFDGCVLLNVLGSFYYIPDEDIVEYKKEVALAVEHSKWIQNLGEYYFREIGNFELEYSESIPEGSVKVCQLRFESANKLGSITFPAVKEVLTEGEGNFYFRPESQTLTLTPEGLFFSKNS